MSSVYTHFEMRFASEEEAEKVFPFVSDYLDLADETDYRIEAEGCIIKDDGGDEGCGFSSKGTEWGSLENLLDNIEKEFGFTPVKSFAIIDARETYGSWNFEEFTGTVRGMGNCIYFDDEDEPYEKYDEVFAKIKKSFDKDGDEEE